MEYWDSHGALLMLVSQISPTLLTNKHLTLPAALWENKYMSVSVTANVGKYKTWIYRIMSPKKTHEFQVGQQSYKRVLLEQHSR